jgi:hypothetical protein
VRDVVQVPDDVKESAKKYREQLVELAVEEVSFIMKIEVV